jgi:uncharacterized membrane protein YcaP (DUF421 family)
MDDAMFFQGWSGLMRVLVVSVLAYVTLVAMLRVSGKRTLSKLNAFDLVVTVALGSTLATVLLSKDVALAEGVVAFALLIGLQYAVAWTSVRSKTVERLVKSQPALLYFRGRFLEAALRAERMTEDEVRAAARAHGHASLETVVAVVLETDGSVSVLPREGNTLARETLGALRFFPDDSGGAGQEPG